MAGNGNTSTFDVGDRCFLQVSGLLTRHSAAQLQNVYGVGWRSAAVPATITGYKGRSFLVDVDGIGKTAIAPSSLRPCAAQTEPNAAPDPAEFDLDSDDGLDDNGTGDLDAQGNSFDDWVKTPVTEDERVKAGYNDVQSGHMKKPEIHRTNYEHALLEYFLQFLPPLSELLALTNAKGKVIHRPSWSLDMPTFMQWIGLWVMMTQGHLFEMYRSNFNAIDLVDRMALGESIIIKAWQTKNAFHRLFATTLAFTESNAFHALKETHREFEGLTRAAWRGLLSTSLVRYGQAIITRSVQARVPTGHHAMIPLPNGMRRCFICKQGLAQGVRAPQVRMSCTCGVPMCQPSTGRDCYATHLQQVQQEGGDLCTLTKGQGGRWNGLIFCGCVGN